MRTSSATAGLEALVSGYVRLFPGEVARTLEEAPPGKVSALLASRPVEHGADVMRRLGPGQAATVLASLPDRAARRMMENLGPARAAVSLG